MPGGACEPVSRVVNQGLPFVARVKEGLRLKGSHLGMKTQRTRSKGI